MEGTILPPCKHIVWKHLCLIEVHSKLFPIFLAFPAILQNVLLLTNSVSQSADDREQEKTRLCRCNVFRT